MKMMDNRTEFPRPHTSEEKTVTTLGSSATKNARIPAKDNFRGCRHCDFTGALKKSGASQVVLVVKNLPANAGDSRNVGPISVLRGDPGVGNGNPLQYSCLENFRHRRDWRTTVHGAKENRTRLSD